MIILLKQTEDRYTWITIDENNRIVNVSEFTALHQHPEMDLKEYFVVILPGESFLSTKVKIPKTSQAELVKAVPFALEEQLVADVNSLYFSLGEFDEQGFLPVIVVDRNYFENELNKIREAKLNPDVIIPDFLAIKKENYHWSIAQNNQLMILRYSISEGLAFDADQFQDMLSFLLKKIPKPEAIDIYFFDQEKPSLFFEKINIIEHRQEFSKSLDIDELQKNPAINLLQGKYRVKTKKTSKKNYWNYVVILFIILVVVLFGGKTIEYFILKSQNKNLQNQIASIYKQVYPNASEVIDPKSRFTRTLANLRKAMSGNIFLDLLAPTAQVLNQDAKVQLISLNFQNNNLTIKLQAKELSVIENFSNRLNQKGFSVQQSQLNTSDQIVEAEFQVRKNGNE